MSDIINLIIEAPRPCNDTLKLIEALFRQTLKSINIYLCCDQSNDVTVSAEKSYHEDERFHLFQKTDDDRDLADTVNHALLSINEGFVQILDSFVVPASDTVYEEALRFLCGSPAGSSREHGQPASDHLFSIFAPECIGAAHFSDTCIFSCSLYRDGYDGILKMDNLPLPIASYIWLVKLSLLAQPQSFSYKLLERSAPMSGFSPDKNFYFPEYENAVDEILNTVSQLRPEYFETVIKELFILEARFYFIACLKGYEVLKGHLSSHIENYYNLSLAPEDIADYLYREYALTDSARKISEQNIKEASHYKWMYEKEQSLHSADNKNYEKSLAEKEKEARHFEWMFNKEHSLYVKEEERFVKELSDKEKEARHFEWMYNKEHALYVKENKRFEKELLHSECLLKKETAAKLQLEKKNVSLSERLDTAERKLSLRLVRVALKIHGFFRKFRKK